MSTFQYVTNMIVLAGLSVWYSNTPPDDIIRSYIFAFAVVNALYVGFRLHGLTLRIVRVVPLLEISAILLEAMAKSAEESTEDEHD